MSQGWLGCLPRELRLLAAQHLCGAERLLVYLAHAPSYELLFDAEARGLCVYCAIHGHLALLQWLRDEQDVSIPDDAYYKAAYYGRLNILQWAHPIQRTHPDISAQATRNGQLHVLKWAKEQGYVFDRWLFEIAVWHGNVEILQWLHENGCPPSRSAVLAAITSGKFHMFKWFFEHMGPFVPYDLYLHAAMWGRVDTFEYLLNHDYELTRPQSVFIMAAQCGQLEMLQWLRVNLPRYWNWQICFDAVAERHPRVLEWLLSINPARHE